MGYIRHHAIVVTSSIDELLEKAHKEALSCFDTNNYVADNVRVSEIVESDINGYRSFFIAPDGSKEGWGESVFGDEQRSRFLSWVDSQAYDDESNGLQYCYFFYGDDNGEAKIIKHN